MARRLPAHIPGYGVLRPHVGVRPAPEIVTRAAARLHPAQPGAAKLLPDLRAAIRACGLRDGATISFHHHLRNGDGVLNAVMAEIAALGRRDIRLAPSSLFPVHAPLARHIEEGTVTGLSTAYISGPVAEAIAQGRLATPAVMQTHGGRARAIETGETRIDVAFVAAPAADEFGNLSGTLGGSACGPLGYPAVDVRHAERVIAVTDCLLPYPLAPVEIAQDAVDFVVEIPSIGDAGRIVSGTTQMTTRAEGRQIAETAAQVIAASGLLRDGFSFQTGAGGISLAVAEDLARIMSDRGVTGSFASGGITGTLVAMFRAGLFRRLLDVQCFDLDAVASYRDDAAHLGMSASTYANPWTKGAVVDRLDAVILGAAEVDLDFNVNVTLGAHGRIIGGSGGHADTAAGAKLAIVTTALTARAHPKIVERVACVTTPGETVDAVVTEAGIAVNPRRADLTDRLRAAGLPLTTIGDLQQQAQAAAEPVAPRRAPGRIVAVSEYRDGTVTDVIEGCAE